MPDTNTPTPIPLTPVEINLTGLPLVHGEGHGVVATTGVPVPTDPGTEPYQGGN